MTTAEAQFHLMTRGSRRSADYRWFPEAPERWWDEEPFATYVLHDHPTLVLEGDGRRWRLYANQMSSAREDAVGSTIMWATAVSSSDPSDVAGLVQMWLLDRDDVGHRLDQLNPSVEDWFTKTDLDVDARIPGVGESGTRGDGLEAKRFRGHLHGGVESARAVEEAAALAAEIGRLHGAGTLVFTSLIPSHVLVDPGLGENSLRLYPGGAPVLEADEGGGGVPKASGRSPASSLMPTAVWVGLLLAVILLVLMTVI